MEKEGLLVVENEYVTMNCQENINALLTNWTGHWNYSKSSRLTYKTIVLVDTRFIGTRFIEIHRLIKKRPAHLSIVERLGGF